jgi:phosphatidylglycerol lysyltransferase
MKRVRNLERVRQLVLQHGWNATTYQLLNPGIRHWFSAEGDAVVGYVAWRNVWVVAGAPVCAVERLADVVESFERAAARHRKRVCYFGAAGRIKSLFDGNPEYSSVVLGAQPVWKPAEWAGVIESHASLRAQLNRARNKGVSVREWGGERTHQNPALCRILGEWLSTRGLPPLHFLVEPQTLSCLFDRRVFVAERQYGMGREAVPVGFLVMSPIPKRNGWLTEQFVRGRGAPNGTVELLMDSAIRTLAAEGAAYVTMGLVPLSQYGTRGERNPLWLHLLLSWIRAHGRRFYNFDGLETFKSKFCPLEWEPIWAVSREPHFSPGTLWAIAGAFSRQPPTRLILRGMGRALRQEYVWLSARGQV